MFINNFRRQEQSHLIIQSAKLFYSLPCVGQEATLISAAAHLSAVAHLSWIETIFSPFYLFNDLLLMCILSVIAKF